MALLQDLKTEAASLGLATWGSIPQLQGRINDHKAKQPTTPADDADDPLARIAADESEDGGSAADAVGSGSPGPDSTAAATSPPPAPAPAVGNPHEYVHRYATHGPPDDQTHANLCTRVRADALAAGHAVRGHGHRVRTVYEKGARFEEYAISIRQE